MKNILASDILVNDLKVDLPDAKALAEMPEESRSKYKILSEEIDRLLLKNGTARGGRISLTAEEFASLDSKLAGLSASSEPGGSSADILTTLKHLLDGNVNVDYLGVAGRGMNGNIIREDLKKTGINLVTADIPGSESALSFVFTEPDGRRTMATYPGNAAELLKPEALNGVIEKDNAMFLPLSLWGKFGEALPNAMLNQAIANDKELIVSLPKQARYNFDTPENAVHKALQNADVVVGDAEELMRMYKTNGDLELAITKLQEDISQRDVLRAQAGKPPRKKPVMAYITHQYKGATVVSAGAQPQRFTVNIPEGGYTLGANDAAYAGFIAGYLGGLTLEASANLAVETAKTKFLYNQVRIPGPTSNAETQKRWNKLRSGFFSNVGNELSLALTGVENVNAQKLPRTFGQKAFDFFLYPVLTNSVVFALSVFVTYKTTYGKEGNFLRKRGDKSREWTAKQLSRVMSPESAKASSANFMMVLWSFLDGSLMTPVVAAVEKKRNSIARWIDRVSGHTPNDEAVYDQETQRDWGSVLKARAATAGIVISTAIALNKFGVNDKLLKEPGAKLGKAINDLSITGKKFSNLSQKSVTNKEGKTTSFMEALGHMSVFELFYTSVCTFGLWVGGLMFSKRKHEKQVQKAQSHVSNNSQPVETSSQQIVPDGAEHTLSTETGRKMKAPESFAAREQSRSAESTAMGLV